MVGDVRSLSGGGDDVNPDVERGGIGAANGSNRTDMPFDRLSTELSTLLKSEEIQQKFSAQYFQTVGSSPAELRTLIQQEKIRWDAVIEALKLSLD